MLRLSINEQKEIVGGYWCVKAYHKKTGGLWKKFYYDTFDEALNQATYLNNLADSNTGDRVYSAQIIAIDEPHW